MSLLNKAAAGILSDVHRKASLLSKTAADIRVQMRRVAFVDRDAEWQRVHSYIADALKDMHVLYAKLARLQGDFSGAELEELDAISESVLDLGEKMSQFSREFSQGNLRMMESPTFQREGEMAQHEPAAPSPPSAPTPAAKEPPAGKIPVIVEGEGPEEWAAEREGVKGEEEKGGGEEEEEEEEEEEK